MADRYFVAEPITGDCARLCDEEAHHLVHVMRAKTGQQVVVFDGSGAEWQAQVMRVGRAEVELELSVRREVDRELSCELTLAVALPKGDRQRWLVEKAVELGVKRLTLTTARGVAQPGDKALTRLRRMVVEASKQCGRNRLMEVTAPMSCSDLFALVPPIGTLRALADPSGSQSLVSLVLEPRGPAFTALSFAVGPEGGFTDDEIEIARLRAWPIIELGPRILRVETTAMYLAAAGAALANATYHLGQAT